MKVVLLAPTPPPAGGIASWTLRMQEAVLKNGWKVEVVDEKLIGGRQIYGEKTKKKLSTELIRCFVIWRNLWKVLKNDEIKIVHSNIPAMTTGMLREYVCLLITKLRKRKFIIHYRCTLPVVITGKLQSLIFRCLSSSSNLVIVLNEMSFKFIKKYCQVPVLIIPNFIERSASIYGNKKIISERIQRVLYVGGVIESKGCLDIIEVAKAFPNIQFRLIGNPESRIRERLKTSNVILTGEKNKEETQEEMRNADIFLFLSYFPAEGFSNSLLEAMANGLPCIVTDWAANREMVEDCGGIVVSVKDVEEAVEALRLLDQNKNLRQKQSIWNIDKVSKCYTSKIVTDMYVDAYESIL
jgi:glycosyltransferase involved in cell wall biosynthesis